VGFVAIVAQVIALLRQRGRGTYGTLQLQFALDDEQCAALKDELLYSQPHVVDDAGHGLVWIGDTEATLALSLAPSSSDGLQVLAKAHTTVEQPRHRGHKDDLTSMQRRQRWLR
jgi:hypothetical protein